MRSVGLDPSPQSINFLNTSIAGDSGTSINNNQQLANGILTFDNCVIDQPLGDTTNFAISRSHSLIAGQPADAPGNLADTTVPGFIDPRPASEAPTDAGDYRLLSTSPLVDAGLNSATTSISDLLGLTRIFDGNNSGTATIDIGAHEFGAPPAPDVLPEIKIVKTSYDSSNGQVILTVDSTGTTPYTVQCTPTLTSWSFAKSGTLFTGTNTIVIPGASYPWPIPAAYFRIVYP